MLYFSHWDLALIAVVSVQATLLAYLHHPKWKALLITLPVPFTFATMAVGRPVDATNATGLVVLLLYTHGVRLLHRVLHVPIILAILISAIGYCLLASVLAPILPTSDLAFWIACGVALTVGLLFYFKLPHENEPGHRSPLPIWIKLPIITCVIVGLVLIKRHLHGFLTLFPMVSLVAAYEARHCLWTICRQIPLCMMTMIPMLITLRLLQPYIGLGYALMVGWCLFLTLLIPLTRKEWANYSDDPTA